MSVFGPSHVSWFQEVCKTANGEMGGHREKGEAIEIEGSKRISSDCSKS